MKQQRFAELAPEISGAGTMSATLT